MSGGGGGGGGSGGGGGITASPSLACDKLIFQTPLNSPVPAVIVSLKKGDRLEVVAASDTGPVVVRDAKGRAAGSITSAQLLDLLACLALKFRYFATVLSVSGGNVQVEIRPEPKP
jgi:hypothetical protein